MKVYERLSVCVCVCQCDPVCAGECALAHSQLVAAERKGEGRKLARHTQLEVQPENFSYITYTPGNRNSMSGACQLEAAAACEQQN